MNNALSEELGAVECERKRVLRIDDKVIRLDAELLAHEVAVEEHRWGCGQSHSAFSGQLSGSSVQCHARS